MKNPVAVVICNYNKKEYVLECIQHVLDSTYKNCDVIIVDNASEDCSVPEIEAKIMDKQNITLIKNKSNLGGSGGFNTGVRYALSQNYKYIMLLDNDAYVKVDAIEKLFGFMEQNEDAAICGCKILSMDEPSLIQDLGSDIDFDRYGVKVPYKNHIDQGDLPEVVYCDYVPACAALVRVSAIQKVGLMPEENFIYWDDIEWGYRFIQAGYKVAVYEKAAVLHKMGSASRANTFATYYFWRNRIRFFGKQIDKSRIDHFCTLFLTELFKATYTSSMLGKQNVITTLMRAYLDGVNDISGIAQDGAVLPADVIPDLFAETFSGMTDLQVKFNGDIKTLRNVLNRLQTVNLSTHVVLVSEIAHIEMLRQQFPYHEISQETRENSTIVEICTHIFDVKKLDEKIIYVDEYLNMMATQQQKDYCLNFEWSKRYFFSLHYDYMVHKILKMNGGAQ